MVVAVDALDHVEADSEEPRRLPLVHAVPHRPGDRRVPKVVARAVVVPASSSAYFHAVLTDPTRCPSVSTTCVAPFRSHRRRCASSWRGMGMGGRLVFVSGSPAPRARRFTDTADSIAGRPSRSAIPPNREAGQPRIREVQFDFEAGGLLCPHRSSPAVITPSCRVRATSPPEAGARGPSAMSAATPVRSPGRRVPQAPTARHPCPAECRPPPRAVAPA